jgi:type II secretory pathway component PulL
MSADAFIIFPQSGAWRIGAMRGGEPQLRDVPAGADIAQNVAAALRELGYASQGAILALPTAWCIVATITAGDLPRHDRKAMLYRLEEKLPIPAEEFVADFAHSADRALGVAVRIAQVKPLIDDLENAGVEVQSIVPAALLAAIEPSRPRAETADQPRIFIFPDDESAHLITLRDRNLHRNLLALSLWPSEMLPLGLSVEAIALGAAPQEMRPAESLHEAALRGASEIAQGRQSAWIELRRDALAAHDRLRRHRRALDALLAAAALLLLAVAGASLLRAARYQRSTAQGADQLVADFKRVFPGWETPASVKSVVQSERRKLASGPGATSSKSPVNRSALRTMQTVLASIPSEPRFSFERMVFADEQFTLEGRMTSLDGLSQFKLAAARQGWDASQSQAHRDGDGFWSFTIHGASGAGAVAARGESP